MEYQLGVWCDATNAFGGVIRHNEVKIEISGEDGKGLIISEY